MTNYTALIGVYVRSYCEIEFTADSDDAALAKAIETYKADSNDVNFHETDWSNKAMPSLVSIQNVDTNTDVREGYDFSDSPADARDYAANEMLSVLSLLEHSAQIAPALQQRIVALLTRIRNNEVQNEQ